MPKKMPEQIRERVVELRRKGASYNQIEREILNPDTGRKLDRHTTIAILREAGLTRSRNAASVAPITPSPSSAPTPSKNPSLPVHSSSGVEDFMPKTPPKKKPTGPIDFACDNCGAEYTADSEEDLPDKCPECGQ